MTITAVAAKVKDVAINVSVPLLTLKADRPMTASFILEGLSQPISQCDLAVAARVALSNYYRLAIHNSSIGLVREGSLIGAIEEELLGVVVEGPTSEAKKKKQQQKEPHQL